MEKDVPVFVVGKNNIQNERVTMIEQCCIACKRTQEQVPLITIAYQNKTFYICPQHLPVLIHNPQMLAGKLPGAEGMSPAEHHD